MDHGLMVLGGGMTGLGAGLSGLLAPQDAYKSPIDLEQMIEGVMGSSSPAGYNTTFTYPAEGLDMLSQRMAGECDIHDSKRAVRVAAIRSSELCGVAGSPADRHPHVAEAHEAR